MATVTRPTAGYTPTNPITNTNKYQADSAATSPRRAINSQKVDGDFNKAFDELSNQSNRLDKLDAPVGNVPSTSAAVADVVMFSDVSDSNALKTTTVQQVLSLAGNGTIATQNANSVAITGGNISGIVDLAIADGGTGASTIEVARANLGVSYATKTEAETGTLASAVMSPLTTLQQFVTRALGWNQTWQNMLAVRSVSTDYQNTTGRPISVFASVRPASGTSHTVEVSSDGATWIGLGVAFDSSRGYPASFVVPNGYYYRIRSSGANLGVTDAWAELR